MPGSVRALPRLSATPHSSQKNSSKIRRCWRLRAEGVEQPQVGIGRREVGLADGGPAVGILEAAADGLGEFVFFGRQFAEDAVGQDAEHARGELRDGLVDGHDAADVERGFAVFIVAGENFELGVQHGELARVAVELDLAEQREFDALGEHVRQVSAVKPFAHEDGARGIGEAGFEQAQ